MKFDPKDVHMTTQSSNGGKGGSKFARELRLTSCTMTLTHNETGLDVEGDIPPGNYSKKKMQQLQEEMKEELLHELEQKVTKVNNHGR